MINQSAADPAASDGEVSPRTSEADLPTDRRSDDVTLAEGVGQRRDWRVLPSSPSRRQLRDQVPHPPYLLFQMYLFDNFCVSVMWTIANNENDLL